ncbi:MAG: hypothetical protein ACP5QG_04935 [candidate division WOR-3 bacterium]
MRFAKLSATGNHFIAIWPEDAHGLDLSDFARRYSRPDQIGADGVIVPLPAEDADFAFTYYNYMGNPVPFCGNAARALPVFARMIGLTKNNEIRFFAGSRVYVVRPDSGGVWLNLGALREFIPPSTRDVLGGRPWAIVDIGVRHTVVFTFDLSEKDIIQVRDQMARFFKLPEAHLNFAEVISPGKIFVRTLEHGYPDEPLSCATGAASAALVHAENTGVGEVEVITRGGTFLLRFSHDFSDIWLWGEVRLVYLGWLNS